MKCSGKTAACGEREAMGCDNIAAYRTKGDELRHNRSLQNKKAMDIELRELLKLMTEAVDAGVQSYIKSVEPTSDFIKQSEAKRFIAKLGYKPVMLQHWVNKHLLTPVKTGEAQNAVVLYSLSEIKTLLSTLRLKDITNRAEHDYV